MEPIESKRHATSDFISDHELPQLLQSDRKRGVKILWVYVRDSFHTETEIGDYQAAYAVSRPLAAAEGGRP